MENNVKVQDETQSRQSCVSVSVTDLRIGNWIMDRGNKAWQIDCWEHSTKVAAKEPIIGFCDFTKKPIHGHPLTEEVDFLKPIPLTEEWVLKLGFSVISENSAGKRYGYVIGGIFSSDLTFTFWKTTKESGKFFRIDLELKSVHQLQNIYHALTGLELQIGNLTEH
jgi:hypothetical protein